jgi:hypothetical protein
MNMRIRPTPRPEVGGAVMRAAEHELRAMYTNIVAEGVPERFAAILRRLDEPTAPRNDAGNRGVNNYGSY